MLKDRVVEVLNSIKSNLRADGGDVELVDVNDEGVVRVRLTGACSHCPMAELTLRMGIERFLKQQVPEVKEVIAVKDGDSPD